MVLSARSLAVLMLLTMGVPVPGAAAPTAAEPAAGEYVVHAAPVGELDLAEPELPDLSPFNAEAVQAKLKRTPTGRAVYRRMVEVVELGEFTGSDGRLAIWAQRQTRNPMVICIEGGYVTPGDLARQLSAEHFEQTSTGVFVLRLPMVVRQGATLHIDGKTRDFRMSEERGAFLVNDGALFITDSALTAWREAENGPATFRDGSRFRPFLLSWGGTETYIVNSRVASLGYAASKSYGVSISQYTPGMTKRMNRKHPTGWLLDSEFVDLWYGFYCYEADDVVIARNVYRDNIVYGIDPHDRSNRLIIAENEAFGTRKSHGIIVSREVNDSWIFRNRAYDNALSGIVLDRSSVNNVVADNTVFGNGSDGITIYESSDNLLWGNHLIGNQRHGIRVRNSVRVNLYHNRVIANGSSGVYGHIKDLEGTDRDLRLDPFEQTVSLVLVGGQLIHNRSGPVAIDSPLSLELYDVDLLAPTKSTGLRVPGILGQFHHELLDLLVRQRVPVVIEPAGRTRLGS